MSQPNFEETVDSLVALSDSDQPLSEAPVDDILDRYLPGFGNDTASQRRELAEAFHKKAAPSARAENVYKRIHGGLMF